MNAANGTNTNEELKKGFELHRTGDLADVVIGWAALGERLHWMVFAGLATILASAAIVNGRMRIFSRAEAAG
ncbi:MAG: hypothetical protein QF450_00090 [Rhodospirillales bacterium]|jgi:hypothetical protein|nr:hypothetical protein [Rhodospirillales bacterium]HJO72580.1 hypothetical protein [Rhodospirillales bacterium]